MRKLVCVLVSLLVVLAGFGPARGADSVTVGENNSIRLRIVLAGSGVPVPGTFSYARVDGGVESGPFATDDEGFALISNLRDGLYEITAATAECPSAQTLVMVSGDQSVDVTLSVLPGGQIRVSGGGGLGGAYLYPTGGIAQRVGRRQVFEGLTPGEYRVLFFYQGAAKGFKRAWYGGGLDFSSAAAIPVTGPQLTSIEVPELPDLTTLPAIEPPIVTGDGSVLRLTANDPELYGFGLGYEMQLRKVGGQWIGGVVSWYDPELNMELKYLGATAGDRLEVRARAYQFGSWSSWAGASSRGLAGFEDGKVTGEWSKSIRITAPYAKPQRVKKPVVWAKGRTATLLWEASQNATRYQVAGKRSGRKWMRLKPRWTARTKFRLDVSKGSWRFRVRADNPRASSAWSKPSRPFVFN